MTVAGRAGVAWWFRRPDHCQEVSMTVATWSIEAIDNALTEACVVPGTACRVGLVTAK